MLPKGKEATLREVLRDAERILAHHGIDEARLESQILVGHILNMEKVQLFLYGEKVLTEEERSAIKKALQERCMGKPVQYIIGRREFMSLDFIVNEKVLIPRPETEILVEKALEEIRDLESGIRGQEFISVLDIGTGSGAIAVSVAYYCPDCMVDAVDISTAALEVAGENAKLHGVEHRVNLITGDLFPPLSQGKKYTLILSNPPYIPSGDIRALEKKVKDFEPRLALDGGKDGLDFYRRIAAACPDYLLSNGLILLEVGLGQAPLVERILARTGIFSQIELVRDFNGIERIVIGRRKGVNKDA